MSSAGATDDAVGRFGGCCCCFSYSILPAESADDAVGRFGGCCCCFSYSILPAESAVDFVDWFGVKVASQLFKLIYVTIISSTAALSCPSIPSLRAFMKSISSPAKLPSQSIS